MHSIANVTPHSMPNPVQGVGTNAATAGGNGFQMALGAQPALHSHGVSASIAPSLGSQTVSTLLQTQDMTQAHGHGGGGHHHGVMKMPPDLAVAQEETEAEGATVLRARKNISKNAKLNEAKEADEAAEDQDVSEQENNAEQESPLAG